MGPGGRIFRGGEGKTGMGKIIVVVEDLISLSSIQQTAKLVAVPVEAAEAKDLATRLEQDAIAAVILDLNNRSGNAIETVRALKTDAKTRSVPVVGFLAHVRADIAEAAKAAGCDVVLARSAFFRQLPTLLLRFQTPPSAGSQKV